MLEMLAWPFVAGLVLAGIHGWFGQHVLARGVVFVDLSLAQMAALGLAVAILAGHPVNGEAGYWYALAFAAGGALIFAAARPHESSIPQEAVIGIVYAVSAAVVILVLDRAPQGTEQIKQLLVGSILAVTPGEVGELALLYAAIGAVHVVFRRPLVAASFNAGHARPPFAWDLLFYGSFAMVVTSSVRIAGVLLVFSYLIIPAALANLVARGLLARLGIAWALGAGLTAAGLWASWHFDLPTGPAIVATFGAAAALAGIAFGLRRLTLRGTAMAAGLALASLGLLALLFPRMDQPWLDAVEAAVPAVHTAFLEDSERYTRSEVLDSIARSGAELKRLQALQQDVNWGRVSMEPEKAERLRQYLAGRSEISNGDRMVLDHLRGKARERQRYGLGIPMILVGLLLAWRAFRRPSSSSPSAPRP